MRIVAQAKMWKIYALLAAIFAAATAILSKIGVKGVNSNLATAIRTVVVLIMAWGIVAMRGQLGEVKVLSRHNLIFLALSGVATGLSWLFYFKALQEGEVSKVASIDKLNVVFVIVFSIFFLGESADVKTLVGAGLIVTGAIIMVV